MKIYFSGSIRGGRDDQQVYYTIIQHLKKYGEVLTEHVGDKTIDVLGEKGLANEIFIRDTDWIKQSDVVIAEVSTPSLGVGYELRYAEELHKKILCLFREREGRSLSAMISGNNNFTVNYYRTTEESLRLITAFLVDN